MHQKTDWKKYLIVLFITTTVFVTAISLSNYFNGRKINQLKTIQDSIAIDILSSETKYALSEELSCTDVTNSFLSSELNTLAQKISYSEENIGGDNEEVKGLKRYYSLLEIKDYLLMKKVSERCKQKPVFVLYFYTTSENCSECTRQGYVLTALREKYPELRVYSFDYSLDLSAVKGLISIYKIEDTKLPALVVNGKLLTGFYSVEDFEKLIPELAVSKETDENPIDAKASPKNSKNN